MNIDSIRPYLVVASDVSTYIDYEVRKTPVSNVLDNLLKLIDLTHPITDDKNYIKSTSYKYQYPLTQCIYLINTYIEDGEKEDLINKVINIHNANIEYEKTHKIDTTIVKAKANIPRKERKPRTTKPKEAKTKADIGINVNKRDIDNQLNALRNGGFGFSFKKS